MPEINSKQETNQIKAMDKMIDNISGFNDDQCQRLKELVGKNIHASGTKAGNARMSKLV